jgi:NAD(P)H-flavin reductase
MFKIVKKKFLAKDIYLMEVEAPRVPCRQNLANL